MMSESFLSYGYILSSAIYLTITLVLGRLTLQPVHFRLMIYAGALNATSGVFCYFLEEHYWMPKRVGGMIMGVEDILIAAVVGMIPWFLVAVIWQKRLTVHFQWRASCRRIACIMPMVYLAYLMGIYIQIDPMSLLLIICAILAAGLLILRTDAWPLAATGFVTFGPAWFLIVWATFYLLPGFVHQWNLDGTWGTPLCGVPLGEIVWALIFGALLPVLVSFTFDVRIAGLRNQAI
ncbi:MAG TPA: hypothetical protein PK090_11440 [Smithellaceae bacterium]|nr:hypothetical protein [Smithellaceae bacterium]